MAQGKNQSKKAEEFPIEELDSAQPGHEKRALDRIKKKTNK